MTGYVGEESWVENTFGKFVDHRDTATAEQGWIFHQTHGWLWVETTDLFNLWLFSPTDGWLWSDQLGDSYNWLYFLDSGWVYYLRGSSNPRWGYSVAEADWIPLPLDYVVHDYFSRSQAPSSVELVEPDYPSGFRAEVEEDALEDLQFVTVGFLVLLDGSVAKARIDGESADVTTTYAALRPLFLEAINQSRFSPGQRGNQTVILHHTHTYRFKVLD